MNIVENAELATIVGSLTSKVQELIILPTEKCNFRCKYCYEDFKIGRMSEKTQSAIEILLSKRIKNLNKLSLSWFGGEPLLTKDIIFRISKFAQSLCREHNVTFSGGITTNGYLLDQKTTAQLISLNQTFYQITLDGSAHEHDKLRLRADGAGTFTTIWTNLVKMQALNSDFSCLLRLHARRENMEDLKILIRQLGSQFGNDQRFSIDIQHLRDLGGLGGASVKAPLSRAELKSLEGELRNTFNMYRPSPPAIGHTPDITHDTVHTVKKYDHSLKNISYICYAARPNSLLIRANGRIGKCTVALNDERNDIGHLTEDGNIEIAQERLHPWLRGLEYLEAESLGCPLKTMPQTSGGGAQIEIPSVY